MQWFTTVPDPKWKLEAQLSDSWLLMGSCFVENLYQYMQLPSQDVVCNPFGIVYHPIVLCEQLKLTNLGTDGIFKRDDGLYAHWLCHSKWCTSSASELHETLEKQKKNLINQLKKATYIVLTPGTAWGYVLQENGRWVANCHKMHLNRFKKKLSKPDEIILALEQTIDYVHTQYGEKYWIFTLSPVRHIKDGIEENMVSKSILRYALAEIVQGASNRYYFPSYEIMLDELRDYRFYAKDMLHPSEEALTYILDKWCAVVFGKHAQEFYTQYQKFKQFEAHRLHTSDAVLQSKHAKQIQDLRHRLEATFGVSL